ncbi:MAG: DUF6478 family protein [Pseudomonadota bacterium]
MAKISFETLSDKILSRQVDRWKARADEVASTDMAALDARRAQARLLKSHLTRLIEAADARLTARYADAMPAQAPLNADWAWRPPLWTKPQGLLGQSELATGSQICDGLKMFFDGPTAELCISQTDALARAEGGPFALALDIYAFEGSFLSFVIDLPQEATDGMTTNAVVQLDFELQLETPIEVFSRLNLCYGPNTEPLVQDHVAEQSTQRAEFDLAYSALGQNRVERGWIDLIFQHPRMNQIVIHDLCVSRRPRAQL